MSNTELTYINKLYWTDDTVVYSGLYCGTKAIIKKIANSPIYGIKHKTIREICSVKKFNCENIAKLFDVKYIVDDMENVTILIYEDCGISINNIDHSKINANCAIECVTRGLQHIHKMGYIHGDLNVSNITMCENNNNTIFKIIDFGNCTKTYRLSAIILPTPYITPIEMLNKEELINISGIDSWALGCLAYYLGTGTQLFELDNFEDLKENVNKTFCEKSEIKSQMSCAFDKALVKNISKLFNTNATKRHSVLKFYKNSYCDEINLPVTVDEKIYFSTNENKDRKFMLNILIEINTNNALPVENLFITFSIVDNSAHKFDYMTDTILIYSLITKLVCGSNFSMDSIVHMLKQVSSVDHNESTVTKKIGIILEHYCWDLERTTLISYLSSIDKKYFGMYIVLSLYLLFSAKYIGFQSEYCSRLIMYILKHAMDKKTKLTKLKNYYRDMNQIKNIMNILTEHIDNKLLRQYISKINLTKEYNLLRAVLR